ncbi:hypothetical protein KKC00_00490 [Patescibacteria group bacterium]|nr:hypothetical protein [Patescibacteria group bacterium]
MAIVFVSPKEKQKVFLLGIVVLFVLFVSGVSLIIFLAEPKETPAELVFKTPEIKINFDVLALGKIKNLDLLSEIEREFNYTAETEDNEDRTGKIAAPSPEKATQILTAMGLSNIILEEIGGGRVNPFSPYYIIEPLPQQAQ